MIGLDKITQAHQLQKESELPFHTKLEKNLKLSEQYDCQVYFKRDDQNLVRVHKMRGAFNCFMNLTEQQKQHGIATVSDGNFAQAVAFFCNHFKVKGTIFVPVVCYGWKVDLIQKRGKEYVTIRSIGDNFDECEEAALKFVEETKTFLVHPASIHTVVGNGTMAIEILNDMPRKIDYLFIPVGQGSLAGGVGSYFKAISPDTIIVGVQPKEADSMAQSIEQKKRITQKGFSRFCDGSAVPSVSQLTFDVCRLVLDELPRVEEGQISTTILEFYNKGIAVEPAGALATSVLGQYASKIKGKNVVCLVTGSTVDLSRFDDFAEHSLLYAGLKYFFLIDMPMKPGVLRSFVSFCLGPEDEISHIQFQKKPHRERSQCLMAIEVSRKENIKSVMENMKKMNLNFKVVNESKEFYEMIV